MSDKTECVIPAGWRLVPEKADTKMIDVGVVMASQVSVHGRGGWSNYIAALYELILSAAPQQPANAAKAASEEADKAINELIEAWDAGTLGDHKCFELLRMLVHGRQCTTMPRITEQDAKEIAESAVDFIFKPMVGATQYDFWMQEEGRALLARLNNK
jgi:hypothetical protein